MAEDIRILSCDVYEAESFVAVPPFARPCQVDPGGISYRRWRAST